MYSFITVDEILFKLLKYIAATIHCLAENWYQWGCTGHTAVWLSDCSSSSKPYRSGPGQHKIINGYHTANQWQSTTPKLTSSASNVHGEKLMSCPAETKKDMWWEKKIISEILGAWIWTYLVENLNPHYTAGRARDEKSYKGKTTCRAPKPTLQP